jgi:hypothetical protein
MKPIKVCEANMPKIQAFLDASNGRATEHTLTNAWAIATITERFEAELSELLPNKALHAGAHAVYRSGQALPNAYKFSRLVTYMEFSRKTTGWFLIELHTRHEYRQAFRPKLTLTAEQDVAAVSKFRLQYNLVDNVK